MLILFGVSCVSVFFDTKRNKPASLNTTKADRIHIILIRRTIFIKQRDFDTWAYLKAAQIRFARTSRFCTG